METKKLKDNVYKITFDKHPETVLYALRDKDTCVVTDHQITDDELENIATNPIVIKDYKGEGGVAGKWSELTNLVVQLLNRDDPYFDTVFKSKEDAARFFYHRVNKPTITSIDNALFFAYGWYECFTFYGGYRSNLPWDGLEMGSMWDKFPALVFGDATFKPTENGVHEPVLDKLFKNGVPTSAITKPFDIGEVDLSSYYSNYKVHSLESLRDEVILFLSDVVDYLNRTEEFVLTNQIKDLSSWQLAWNKGKNTTNLINEFLRYDFLNKSGRNPFGR